MHVASTQIHEAAPLRRDDGALDIERIQEYVLSRLDRHPALPPEDLAHTPIEGHPVWVDDGSASTSATTCATRGCRIPATTGS